MVTIPDHSLDGCKITGIKSDIFIKSLNKLIQVYFLSNTYFTLDVPTALLLLCNWPITGIGRRKYILNTSVPGYSFNPNVRLHLHSAECTVRLLNQAGRNNYPYNP